MIKLYDSATIESLASERTAVHPDWINYLLQLMKNGPDHYATNFSCDFFVVQVNDKVVPIAVNNRKGINSHLTSINIYYISFGIASLKFKFKSKPLFLLIKSVSFFLQRILQFSKLDRCVFVNCWLMPTGPITILTRDEYNELIDFLKTRFPSHALAFRGFGNFFHIEDVQPLEKDLLLSKIFYTIDDLQTALQKKDVRRSLALLKKPDYQVGGKEQLQPEEHEELLSLYNKLYIGKFSQYSLHFTPSWFDLARMHSLFEIHCVRDNEGALLSFIVTFTDREWIVSSIGAFRQNEPYSLQLYMLNFANRMQEAMVKEKKINLSSGGDKFKKNRGGQGNFEYDIVHYCHLKSSRRWRWLIFMKLYKNIATNLYTGLAG